MLKQISLIILGIVFLFNHSTTSFANSVENGIASEVLLHQFQPEIRNALDNYFQTRYLQYDSEEIIDIKRGYPDGSYKYEITILLRVLHVGVHRKNMLVMLVLNNFSDNRKYVINRIEPLPYSY